VFLVSFVKYQKKKVPQINSRDKMEEAKETVSDSCSPAQRCGRILLFLDVCGG